MQYEFDGRMFWAVDDYDRVVWGIDSLDLHATSLQFLEAYVSLEVCREEHPDFDRLISAEAATERRGLLANFYVLMYYAKLEFWSAVYSNLEGVGEVFAVASRTGQQHAASRWEG